MKSFVKKTVALVLSGTMLLSIPVSAGAYTINNTNGKYRINFNSQYGIISGGKTDPDGTSKTVRFEFDTEDEVVNLNELVGQIDQVYYNCIGWKLGDSDEIVNTVSLDNFINGNRIAATAVYDINNIPKNSGTYYLSLNLKNGTFGTSKKTYQLNSENYRVETYSSESFSSASISAPTLENAEFVGWYGYDSETGTHKKFTRISKEDFEKSPTDVIELTAVYQKIADSEDTADFKLDANGGTLNGKAKVFYNAIEHGSVEASEQILIDCFVPEKTNYIFKGWNTKQDGSGETVQVLSYSEVKNNPGKTYYAVWEEEALKTKLVFGKGTSDSLELQNEDGSNYYVISSGKDSFETITLPNAQLDGGEFLGWYIYNAKTSTYRKVTTVTKDDIDSDNSCTVYASYKKKAESSDKKQTITLNANSGYIDGKKSERYINVVGNSSETQILDGFIPTKTGYAFTGWNTKLNGSGKTLHDTGSGAVNAFTQYGDSNQNITLYAQWKNRIDQNNGKYCVTFYSDYGYFKNGNLEENGTSKLVRFDFGVEDEIVNLDEIAPDIYQVYYNRIGWRIGDSDEIVNTITTKDFLEGKRLSVTAVYDTETLPKNSGKYYINLNLKSGIYNTRATYRYNSDNCRVEAFESEGFTMLRIPKPTLENAEFIGWYRYDSETDSYRKVTEVTKEDFEKNSSDVISLTAVYQKIADSEDTADFILDANGGTLDDKAKVFYNAIEHGSIEASEQILLDCFIPERPGYIFRGWNTEQDGTGEKVQFISCSDILNNPKTYYAVWEEETYNTTFIFGKGTSPDFELDTENGSNFYTIHTYKSEIDKLIFPNAEFEKGEFLGWYVYDVNKNNYRKVTYITPDDIDENDNCKVFAAYKQKTAENDDLQTITLDANGGTIDGEEKGIYNNVASNSSETQILDDFIPERKGYVFKGWNTKQDGTGDVIRNTGTGEDNAFTKYGDSDNNLTLYAMWEEDAYKIIINPVGGLFQQDNTLPKIYEYKNAGIYEASILEKDFEEIELPISVLYGAKFLGWFLYDEETGGYVKKTKVSKEDLTFNVPTEYIASYAANDDIGVFNLRFPDLIFSLDANGGKIEGMEEANYHPIFYYDGSDRSYQIIDSFIPEREGYKFLGWNTEKDGSGEYVHKLISYEYVNNDEQTFYAQWEKTAEVIKKVQITIDTADIKAGDAPSFNAVLKNAHYHLDRQIWSEVDGSKTACDNEQQYIEDFGDNYKKSREWNESVIRKFEEKKYCFSAKNLVADDGYIFSSSVEVYVNGRKAVILDSSGSSISFRDSGVTLDLSNSGEPVKEPEVIGKMGDLDGDGKIDSADSLFILRASVKLETLTENQETLADIDGDGRISSADALQVLRYSVKLPIDGNVGEEVIK